MITVEIAPNPNCEPVDLRVFHDLEPPRQVHRVCLARPPGPPVARAGAGGDGEGRAGEPKWHEVTGWTAQGAPCPALAQRVDDSGEGTALLVYGGDAGLRFRPAGTGPWRLEDPQQWGEPFRLTTDSEVS